MEGKEKTQPCLNCEKLMGEMVIDGIFAGFAVFCSNKCEKEYKEETKIHCFECEQMIRKRFWLPINGYGCSRHQ